MRLCFKLLIMAVIFCCSFRGDGWAIENLEVQPSWKDQYREAAELFRHEDYQKALDLAQATLEKVKTEKGNHHINTLRLYNLVAIIQLHLGTDAIAESSFIEVIAGLEATKATNTRLYAITLENLGSMYLLQDYYDLSEDHLKRALKIFQKVLGEGHVRVAVILNSLGLLYSEQGNYTEAEKYLLQSREVFKESKQNLQGEKSVMFHNLGELYLKLEQYDKAERNAKKAIKSQTKMVGKAARRRAATFDLLKRIYQATKRDDDVTQMQNELDLLRETLPTKASPYVTDLLIWKIDKV